MKYIFICLFILVGVGSFAQETPEVNVYSSSLSVGEVLNLNKRSIVFKNVVSDSRCPKDVTCVWAGEAKVTVEIYEDGNTMGEKIIVINSSNIPVEFSLSNVIYSIRGISLTPYPSVNKEGMPKNYVLQMSVRETLEI